MTRSIPKYRLVGEAAAGTFTLGQFLDDNPDLPLDDLDRIRGLERGDSVTLGGGAWDTYTIRRVR